MIQRIRKQWRSIHCGLGHDAVRNRAVVTTADQLVIPLNRVRNSPVRAKALLAYSLLKSRLAFVVYFQTIWRIVVLFARDIFVEVVRNRGDNPVGYRAKPMSFVTIPFDFKDLGSKNTVVPIVINDTDERGRKIAWRWFEAVVPVADLLRRMARRRLDDVQRVSELSEVTVHGLWETHEYDFGVLPQWRVYWRATRVVEDLRCPWRLRKGFDVALDDLEAVLLRARGDFAAEYQFHDSMEALRRELRNAGKHEAAAILDQLLHHVPWDDVVMNLGEEPTKRKVNTIQRRFWRTVRAFIDLI